MASSTNISIKSRKSSTNSGMFRGSKKGESGNKRIRAGIDFSRDDKCRIAPRTPLSPLKFQSNLLNRGQVKPGGASGWHDADFRPINPCQNLNSETFISNGLGLQCLTSGLRGEANGTQTDAGGSNDKKRNEFESPNLRSEQSKRSLARGLSAQQALKKSIKKLNKTKQTPVSSFDYNQSQSPSPSPGSDFELDEDLRTFEEKYKIIDNVILGEVSKPNLFI